MVKYLGHFIFAYVNGRLYDSFDVFYLLFHAISDYIVIVLIVFLGLGWTVFFTSHKSMDLYIPIAVIYGFVHIIVVILNKAEDGNIDKYHMFDSIPAYVMLGFRMWILIGFIAACMKTMMKVDVG